jgi:hypothetical protein
MMKNRFRFLLAAGVLLLSISPANANVIFASISGDPTNGFVPDQFSSVDKDQQTVTTVATLGDGSLAFNGGLAYGSGGTLFAIANDFTGAGSLYTIQPDGTLALVGSAGGLGFGFLGGLTYDTQNSTLYAAVTDNLGNTTLDSISNSGTPTALGQSIGTGYSGLAFDSANNSFYGIGNDNSGQSTLYDFTLGNSPAAVSVLGFGFGALTYDVADDLLFALDPVNNAGAQLYSVTPAGSESGPLFTLGDGFVELAAPAPEPASAFEVGGILLGSAWLLRKMKKKA